MSVVVSIASPSILIDPTLLFVKFLTFTDDLIALADWLESFKYQVVAMEATGVYWIPLFECSMPGI